MQPMIAMKIYKKGPAYLMRKADPIQYQIVYSTGLEHNLDADDEAEAAEIDLALVVIIRIGDIFRSIV
jgi:hypothetical protein